MTKAEMIVIVLNASVDLDLEDVTEDKDISELWKHIRSISERYQELKRGPLSFTRAARQAKVEWLERFLA